MLLVFMFRRYLLTAYKQDIIWQTTCSKQI